MSRSSMNEVVLWCAVVAVVVASAGCSKIIGLDGTRLAEDGGAQPDAAGEPPDDCDADDDGFFSPHPACDGERASAPPDCDDTRDDVKPGAPVVCGDGAINGCLPLPGEVLDAYGIAELGVVGIDTVYLGEVGGFHNNVSMAARGTRVVIAASESAITARVLSMDIDDPANASDVSSVLPTDAAFANTAVEVVRLGDGTMRLGTLGRENIDYSYQYRPMFADIAPDASSATWQLVAPTQQCPLDGEPDDRAPVRLSGLTEHGGLFFEIATPGSSALRAFHARPEGLICKDLVAEGVPYSEFGTQLVASGGFALGLFDDRSRVWTWEEPPVYNDLFSYMPSQSVLGQGDVLARNIPAGDPVFFAYRAGGGRLVLEALDCVGRDPCERSGAADIVAGGDVGEVQLAPMARGALLVTGVQPDGFDGPTDVAVRFVDETGGLLGGELVVPLASIGATADESLRRLDLVTLPPSASRAWWDILVAMTIERRASDQPEIRLLRARACNEM